ncbi:hypothetical protein JXQ31_20175 [candidate division KSB1 bacterium]|nr:hypothetical protein [candidate division KSB1 bacterium]
MKVIYRIFLSLVLTAVIVMAQPVKVEVIKTNDSYQLMRDGKPYFIKGAGGGRYLNRLAAYGGNSVRTWGTRGAENLLDQANQLGLTVMLGLNVQPERHGFDYSDSAAVAGQMEACKREVLKYKDHPALLLWAIGNELDLQYTNTKVWDAVQVIAKMIHDIDPNHPATTVTAGIDREEVRLIKKQCPDIDILTINTYGGLPPLPQQIRDYGWEGAYIVGEWGPTGHWEVQKTKWNTPIEETSSEKAAVYKQRYEAAIKKDTERCIGSYVFLWGQKQERTPTWYGVFLESGEESEVVDVIRYLWSGTWPENRAPHIDYLRIEGKDAAASVYLNADKIYHARAQVTDPDQDKLVFRWEIMPESTDLQSGGDRESRPDLIPGLVQELSGMDVTFRAPDKQGAYRLFVYVYDDNNNVAAGNIPFYVNE